MANQRIRRSSGLRRLAGDPFGSGNAQARMALSLALSALPEIYRSVFVLRDVEQLSGAETAKILGISEPAVRTRLLRARLQMRDALAPGFDGSWNTGSPTYKKVRPW